MKNISNLIIQQNIDDSYFDGGDADAQAEAKGPGFEWIPKEMREIKSETGLEVRAHLKLCVAMHGLFLILEVLMYNWVISMWFTEIVLGWLAYNAYMRM